MPPTITAETAYGAVSGLVEDGVARFLGIPYAAAPVGGLRFAAPAPPEPWEGVREAHKFGATPPKPPIEGKLGELMPDPSVPGEDWLNLNVWTPDKDGSAPVMVWIHGGAFVTGSSAVTAYNGAAFARRGVVCVSLNYRLGVDGFAYIQDAPVRANRGLLDQIAALEWVRDNIANFGGDPGNVTVFGESAGAMSVITLLSLELGLFHRAIAQSGTGHIAQDVEDAKKVTAAVAELLGQPATAAGLAAVDIDVLTEKQAEISSDITMNASEADYGASTISACGMSFMPVIDGELLKQRPIDAIHAGAGADIPLLLGTNMEEFRLFVVPTAMVYWPFKKLFQDRAVVYGCPENLWDIYAQNGGSVYPRRQPSGIMCALMTDRMFRIPSYRIAESRNRSALTDPAPEAAPTFVYQFGWRSQVTPNDLSVQLGACHSLEIPFMWDALDDPNSKPMIGSNPPEDLATTMIDKWAEFAKTGTAWERYHPDSRQVMSFYHDNKDDNQVVPDPNEQERKHWEGKLEPRRA